MTGSRTKAPDLTTRLDTTDILNIFEMVKVGNTMSTIYKAYHISYSSLIRVLSPWNWTPAQKHHWDFVNLPEINWPDNYKQPKNTIQPEEPIPGTATKSKPTFVHQKNTEFEAGASDAKRYQNGSDEPHPDDCAIEFSDNKPTTQAQIDTIPRNQAKEFMETAKDLELHGSLPELDHLFPTPRDRINRKELLHRLESVEYCFELMAEEYAKLKAFLKE